MKNMIYNSLLALFAVVFVGSGAVIGYKLVVKNKAEGQIEGLKSVFEVLPAANGTSNTVQNGVEEEADAPSKMTLKEQIEARKERLTGYAKLLSQNGDMRGWVTIPGTKVDYPVMQSVDRPDFYLKHNFDRQKSSYGTPYIAESCDVEAGEDNIVIYGHHMKDGTMFGGLMKYTEESYYKAHPFIWFDTLDRVGAYQIIAVAKASAVDAGDGKMFELAADQTKRQEFLEEVNRRGFYDTGEIKDNGKPLLVLITCEYTQKEGRLLLVARKLDGIEG